MATESNMETRYTPKPHLRPLTIILPLTGERGILEPPEDLLGALGWVGQHRLEGDARSEAAVGRQLAQAVTQQG